VSVCTITDGRTDGITDGQRMSDTCPVCTITDGIADGLPTDRKVWRGFRTFFGCAFQLITDEITDRN
jgi:hypothetical protein